MTAAAFPALLQQNGPLLVLGVTVAARIGVPVPASALLMATGALAAAGHWSPAFVLLLVALSVLANVLGDGVWFWAGRRHGARVMKLLCGAKADGDCAERGARTMRRWGAGALLAAKFVPGVSTVAPPMAGAMGMTLKRFVVAEVVAGLIWTLAFMGLGAVFGKQVEALLKKLSSIDPITGAMVLVALAVAGALVWAWSRRRRNAVMASQAFGA